MIITEQLYKNLYRPYYHGSRNGELKQGCILYLTNTFSYAAMYACEEDCLIGKVFEFSLKDSLNIFNAKSQKDVQRFRLYVKKNNLQLSKEWYWKGMQNEDWSFLFRDTNLKNVCIDVMRKLNYDGFFNFEWTRNVRDFRNKDNEFKGQFLETSPAIDIFDIDKLKRVREFSYKDYFNFEDFVEVYNKEKQELINYAGTLYKNDKLSEKYVLYFAQDRFLFLTIADVKDVADNIEDYINSDSFEINTHLDECIKYGKSLDDKYKLSEDFQVVPMLLDLDRKGYREYKQLNRDLKIREVYYGRD